MDLQSIILAFIPESFVNAMNEYFKVDSLQFINLHECANKVIYIEINKQTPKR